jgi:hypothetical protein
VRLGGPPRRRRAVGYNRTPSGDSTTLAEQWNDQRWQIAATPNPTASVNAFNGLTAIAAVDYIAVGRDSVGTLVEEWDGHAWSVETSANPASTLNSLVGVTADSQGTRWTVGSQASSNNPRRTLVERSTAGSSSPSHATGWQRNLLVRLLATEGYSVSSR